MECDARIFHRRTTNYHWDGSCTVKFEGGEDLQFCKHKIIRPVCKRCNWWLYFWNNLKKNVYDLINEPKKIYD